MNKCGLHILQKIAGLTKARAKAILDTRNKLGKFTNREQVVTDYKIVGILTFIYFYIHFL